MELVDVHLAVLAITALVILYSDHQGFGYFRGKKALLSPRFVHYSHWIVWVGLVAMIATGVGLVIPSWQVYLMDPAFQLKIGFVVVLVVNGFAIGKLAQVASVKPFALLPKREKRTLMISGSLSVIGWVSSSFIGYFLL